MTTNRATQCPSSKGQLCVPVVVSVSPLASGLTEDKRSASVHSLQRQAWDTPISGTWHAFEGAERGRSHLVARHFVGLRCCSTVMEAPRFEGKGSCPETDDEGYHIGNGYIVPVLGRLLLSLDDAT